MRTILDHIEDIAPTVKTFWFRPRQKVRYVAGQFTELYLPHDGADKRGIRRWFTLSSSPTEELLAITTGFTSDAGSSFKQQLANLKPGAEIDLANPMGDFVLPKDPGIPLVLIAAGLGITPVRSMVKWLHDTGQQRNIQLIQAAPPDELAFRRLFEQHNLRYMPITANQRQLLTAPALLGMLKPSPSSAAPLIYLSGPELLVETLYKDLQAAGIQPERLVADYFPGYKN